MYQLEKKLGLSGVSTEILYGVRTISMALVLFLFQNYYGIIENNLTLRCLNQ